jgi:starch-binding outer membrane protein, SusD/RagB family
MRHCLIILKNFDMKNKIIFLLLIIVATFFLVSCDVLKIDPVDSITQDSYWKTPAEATAAAIGLNDRLQNVSLWTGVWGDLRADIFSRTRGNLVGNLLNVMNNNLSPGTEFGNWARLYTAIGQANWMLSNLPKVNGLTETQLNEFIGEAKFARAYCYYYAVRIWGDVPLITEPYTSATQDFLLPRTPKAQVLAQIEADIDDAVAKAPKTYGSVVNTKGRPTHWAALALKTDFSLWMAKVEGQAAYLQKSLDAANTLITTGSFNLVPTASYLNIFSAKNTVESIYEIQFNVTQNELQDAGNGNSNSPAALSSYAPFGQFNRLLVAEKLIAIVESGDKRFEAITLDLNSTLPKYIKYRGTPTGTQEVTYYDANIIIYRLADIILLKAEALNELNRTDEAITELNRIRTRAGLPATTAKAKAEVKDAILKERYIELCAEGKRWFDLIRNGVVSQEIPLIINSDNILWPIHESLINANSKLEQNAYYR